MKSGITKILQGALALSLLLSIVFSIQFIMLTRQARSLSNQVTMANMYQTTIQRLLVDCVNYSTNNPAILPVLKSVGVEVKPPSK